jgi:SAM-dependent methyltransferase
MKNNIQSWSDYAIEYNSSSMYSIDFIHTGLGLSGINPKDLVCNTETVLDVGCGNGLNTFLISQIASGKTIGIDPVKININEAVKKYSRKNLEYFGVGYDKCLAICKNTNFDLITFFGSLDYIILNQEFFSILNKLTHQFSRCYISKFHPFWTTLFKGDVERREIMPYFLNGRVDIIEYGNKEKIQFFRYHYSLSSILSLFNNNGWLLTKLEEPKPDMKKSAFAYTGYDNDPELAERLEKIPMTLILEFKREAL